MADDWRIPFWDKTNALVEASGGEVTAAPWRQQAVVELERVVQSAIDAALAGMSERLRVEIAAVERLRADAGLPPEPPEAREYAGSECHPKGRVVGAQAYADWRDYARALRAAAERIMRERNEALEDAAQARRDRMDALSVTTREGLSCSEWIARTGKAERERDEALDELAALKARGAEPVAYCLWDGDGWRMGWQSAPPHFGKHDLFLAPPETVPRREHEAQVERLRAEAAAAEQRAAQQIGDVIRRGECDAQFREKQAERRGREAALAGMSERLRVEIAEQERLKRSVQRLEAARRGDQWLWQGDGTDDPDSLTCDVLVSARQVQEWAAASWQPVETAPRGVAIDVWTAPGGERYANVVLLESGTWWAEDFALPLPEGERVTHWRPIPAPPVV